MFWNFWIFWGKFLFWKNSNGSNGSNGSVPRRPNLSTLVLGAPVFWLVSRFCVLVDPATVVELELSFAADPSVFSPSAAESATRSLVGVRDGVVCPDELKGSISNLSLIFQPNEQTLQGSFSSVSTPNFATKYALESSWRDLQDLHAFAPLRPQYFRKFRQTFSHLLVNFLTKLK